MAHGGNFGGPRGGGNRQSQTRKIFIGGLNYNSTEESLKSHFSQYGELIDVVVMKFPDTKRSRGFGFVTFSKDEEVDACQEARPHTIDGKTVETKRATPREEFGKPEAGQTVKKVFVGGLKEDMTEDDIRQYFEEFGKIVAVTRLTEKDTGKPRGFGFVEFDDYDPVDKAILKQNHQINGKRVDVKKAVSKQEMNSMGGDGGGRGGMRGGGRGGGRGQGGWGGGSGRGGGGGGYQNQGGNGGYGGNQWGNNGGGDWSGGNDSYSAGWGGDASAAGGWGGGDGGNQGGWGGPNSGGGPPSGNQWGGSSGGGYGGSSGGGYGGGGSAPGGYGNGGGAMGGGYEQQGYGGGPMRGPSGGGRGGMGGGGGGFRSAPYGGDSRGGGFGGRGRGRGRGAYA